MLYQAFFWNEKSDRPPYTEFQHHPEFIKHTDDWGKEGDVAFIAEIGSIDVGAVWYRHWCDEHHSYGYVDAKTPELGIAIEPDSRGKGIGRLLLREILRYGKSTGLPSISLSVNPKNYARRMYASEGFVTVLETEEALTMLCKF